MENTLNTPPTNSQPNHLDQGVINVDHTTAAQATFNRPSKKLFLLKRLLKREILISSVVLLLLVIGAASAFFLSSNSQDVRQQASGCVYWNGEAATEGAVDNRGGIRQECKNGLWTVPDDGNLDPSEIIAEEEAARPKRPCVSWDGSDAPHGTVDIRGDIRQQCKDGLWNVPNDGITDPKQVGAVEVSDAIAGMESGDLSYQESVQTYNEHCRENIASGAADFCKRLDKLLREEADRIRYTALDEAVRGNTASVTDAIEGLDDRSLGFADASNVYKEYCTGAKAQQTSVSTCQALRASLDELTEIREAAETAKYTALTDIVTNNSLEVTTALNGLEDTSGNVNDARSTYQEYCTGAKAQQTSTSACASLRTEIDKITTIATALDDLESRAVNVNDARSTYQEYCANTEEQETLKSVCTSLRTEIDGIIAEREAAETTRLTALTVTVTSNSSSVKSAREGLQNNSLNINEAQTTYQQYCTGAKAQQTSTSECSALSNSISEHENNLNATDQETIEDSTMFTNQVTLATSSLEMGIMDPVIAQSTYNQYCTGPRAQETSTAACSNLRSSLSTTEGNTTSDTDSGVTTNDSLAQNNSRLEQAILNLEDEKISIEEALLIEEQMCSSDALRALRASSAACQELDSTIDSAFTTRRWQAYQAVVEENIQNIASIKDDVLTGQISIEETEQRYISACLGVNARHTPTSVCDGLRETLADADIFISNFAVERVIPNQYLEARNPDANGWIFSLAEQNFTDFNSDVDFEYITVRNDLARIVNNEALEMSEFGTETIHCQVGNSCQYYHDGIVETITFMDIVNDIEGFNLDEESFNQLRRNGVVVNGRSTSDLIRETNDELAPFEIRICVRDCEWIAPTDENVRGVAYTVISDMDDYTSIVPDMNGDGYVFDNDLTIYLANAPLDDLLEIVVTNDSNWNEYEAQTLLSNYDSSDLHLILPNDVPYSDYQEAINSLSLTDTVQSTYGIDVSGQSFWDLEEALSNVNQYVAYSTFTNILNSNPVTRLITPFINRPTQQIENCSLTSHSGVCDVQRTIINTVNATNEIVRDIDTWEDRTGVSLQYAGNMDIGTLMVFDYAIDLLPEFYWDGMDGVVVTEGNTVHEESAGYTYMSGTFQMDSCNSGCTNYGSDFWWHVKVLAHETAHNRQDITVDAGNYCFDSGDCMRIDEAATGRDILDEYLSENGITANPDDSLSVSGIPSISYYDDEAYAFFNAKEFYAEVLSDAIIDPDGMAAADPELYRLAVIVNGFETESYIDENGIEMIRRKSQ